MASGLVRLGGAPRRRRRVGRRGGPQGPGPGRPGPALRGVVTGCEREALCVSAGRPAWWPPGAGNAPSCSRWVGGGDSIKSDTHQRPTSSDLALAGLALRRRGRLRLPCLLRLASQLGLLCIPLLLQLVLDAGGAPAPPHLWVAPPCVIVTGRYRRGEAVHTALARAAPQPDCYLLTCTWHATWRGMGICIFSGRPIWRLFRLLSSATTLRGSLRAPNSAQSCVQLASR